MSDLKFKENLEKLKKDLAKSFTKAFEDMGDEAKNISWFCSSPNSPFNKEK